MKIASLRQHTLLRDDDVYHCTQFYVGSDAPFSKFMISSV